MFSKKTMWFLSFLFIPAYAHVIGSAQNLTSGGPCTDQNHLFLAPGVLSAGGVNRACVSRFYPEGSARMVLTLLPDDGESVTAARDLPPGDGGCLDIAAPMRPNTKADLIVNMRYKEASCVWERRMTVRIGSARVVSLLTERAKYRPGDTLRLRAIVLKADLTPAQGDIDEIWLEGPRGAWDGVRAAEWLGVRTRLGLAQLQHVLDEDAPPGRWVVRARLADGSQGATAFTVGNYELPPFQLSVRHAPRVLRTSERLVWTVCVRYPWSEAVEGMLVIRLRGAGGGGGGEAGGVRTAVRLRARACHRHAAAARRVGLQARHPPTVVIADFSFQEEGTRVWQNTTVVSEVVDDPVTLEFLTKHRAVLSPSLPYKLKVKATRWDDKPAVGERVRVCRRTVTDEGTNVNTGTNMNMGLNVNLGTNMNMGATVNSGSNMNLRPNVNMGANTNSRLNKEVNDFSGPMGPATCVSALTDNRGVARLTFAADRTTSALYHFQARLQNATAGLVLACVAGASPAALGPLRPPPHAARTLVPLYLDLAPPTTPLTVHFVVITRGGTIYRWGATTQCPTTTPVDQLLPAPRNSSCELQFPDLNNVDSEPNQDSSDSLERHLPRIMLPVKVSHQMCPDSHLMAYFLHDGELVSASKHFEMDECFGNKAEAKWLSRQVSPGAAASLAVSTTAPALCALSALDTASTWLQRPASAQEQLLTALRRLLAARRNLTEYDAAGDCFLALDAPPAAQSGAELAAEWLASAGVRTLPSAQKQRCRSPPPAQMVDDVTVPRADFSEAWLWRLVAVGLNGTVTTTARAPDSITRYEASVVCLSRTGIAIAPPAVLQVFREFFIHADGPKRLRKGDNTIIRYRIFNYLYEPLGVQIEVSGDRVLEVRASSSEACVGARSSASGRVELVAREAGKGRLRVRAKAKADGGCNANSGSASDEVIIEIEVEPEGVPTQEFKSTMLCAGTPDPVSSNVSWSWRPRAVVPGTESVTVWAAGDALGPMLADADALVTMPRGCGEQNMARLATNLLALKMLDPKTTAAAKALRHVHRGFARQLQYAHASGGFSAFGVSDSAPSTWLTAFCLRYLRTAYQVISPGARVPPVVERAERWLLSQQMENGCFRNDGQVFHRELKGGLNEEGEIASVALTAYVVTSLVEGSANLPFRVIRNSLSCLRALPLKKSKTHTGVYAHSLLSYAFMRLRRYEEDLRKTNEAYLWDKRESTSPGLRDDEEIRELMQFLKLAKRSQDYVYWESSSLATSIEATAYGALSLAQCPLAILASCQAEASAAVRWLSAHRGPTGGFVSTQDTLVAMEALAAWSSLRPVPPANLTVAASTGRRRDSVTIVPGTRVPDILKMGPGDHLTVTVQGHGCAIIQATRSYRTTAEDVSGEGSGVRSLNVQVSVKTDGAFDCNNGTNCFCAAIVEACVVWSGSFPEMALLEITLPGGFGADAARLYSQLNERDTLLRRIEMSSKGGQVALYLSRNKEGTGAGHECYSVHAVGPQANTRPAHVKLLDYYRPSVKSVQMYTIPEECPARISHNTDSYLPQDNLFNKAKSLETGEIIISEEFSFEDIPEGTPLEDPIFENLTKKKDINTSENNEGNNNIMNIKQIKENKSNVKSNDLLKENIIKTYNETYIKESITKVNQKFTKEAIKELPQVGKIESSVVDNPNLSGFHIIDSEKDLEVPTGIEGPVPSVVLPPKDFVFGTDKTESSGSHSRGFQPPSFNFEHVIRHRRRTNYAKG